MRHLRCKPEEIEEHVSRLAAGIDDPLYRGIGSKAKEEFDRTGLMEPNPGSLSAGTGVFFTDSFSYAKSFARAALLITSRKILDPQGSAIDTRVPGYDVPARARLERRRGPGNFTGYDVWDEIVKEDTWTDEGGRPGTMVFAKRSPVSKDQIIARIEIVEDCREEKDPGYIALDPVLAV